MRFRKTKRGERGFAVILVLSLLVMMVAIVMANSSALFGLKREVKNADKRQQARWSRLNAAVTNSLPVTNSPSPIPK
jgi:type II secretory pathway component PulK